MPHGVGDLAAGHARLRGSGVGLAGVPAADLALKELAAGGATVRTGDLRLKASANRERWDADREFLSQGAANLGAGAFQGMPVSTSLSASACWSALKV